MKSKIKYAKTTPESFDGEKAMRFMFDEFGTVGSVGIQCKTKKGAKKKFKELARKFKTHNQ
jgi:hypothetical protein